MRLSTISPMQALVALVCLAMAAPAAAKNEAKVLVIPVHEHAGRGFDAAVERLVEKPLKRHATVLAPTAYHAALRRARVPLRGLRDPRAVQKVGRVAGVAFVLVVEASGRRPHLLAEVTLVEVASGKALFSDRYPLSGGKLSAEVAAQMLSPVADKLSGDSGGDQGSDAVGDAKAAGGKKKAGKGDKFAFPSAGATAPGGEGDGEADGDAAATPADDDAAAPSDGTHGPRWRPGLRLGLGATFMRRTGTLVGTLPPNISKLPCYCGQGSAANPFFPGVQLKLEFFPWALLGGTGASAIEGLGLQLELFATQIKSYITYYDATGALAQPSSIVSSTVLSFKAGLAFRYVFWDAATAPDLQVDAGLSVFSFPLHNGTFPGVAYTSPSLGLQAHIPLGIEQLALLGGFTFYPAVLAGDDAGNKINKMLGTQSGGNGLLAEGGLRFAFDIYEVAALLRYEAYSVAYQGPTNLALDAANEKQLSNIGLKDSLLQITLTAGLVF